MFKKALSCVLATVMAFSLISCSSGTTTTSSGGSGSSTSSSGQSGSSDLIFAHNSTEVSPWNQGVEAAISYLTEQTDGRYTGTSYPNGSLFQSNWDILLEMVQTNSIQFGVEAISALAAINSDANFLCLPFLFENNEQVYNFLNSDCQAWEDIINSFEESNIVILGVSPRPMRQISNNRHPINTLEDFDGLTLRAPSNNLIVDAMEALGINAVPMSSGEIFSAIQLGTVDGEDNSLAQQYDAKSLEVVSYFCICNYVADGSVMFCSKDFYDSLSAEDQEILQEMGRIFAETSYEADNDYYDVAYNAAVEMGVEFTTLPAEEQARCRDACASVYAEYEAMYDPDVWAELMAAVDAAKQ